MQDLGLYSPQMGFKLHACQSLDQPTNFIHVFPRGQFLFENQSTFYMRPCKVAGVLTVKIFYRKKYDFFRGTLHQIKLRVNQNKYAAKDPKMFLFRYLYVR